MHPDLLRERDAVDWLHAAVTRDDEVGFVEPMDRGRAYLAELRG